MGSSQYLPGAPSANNPGQQKSRHAIGLSDSTRSLHAFSNFPFYTWEYIHSPPLRSPVRLRGHLVDAAHGGGHPHGDLRELQNNRCFYYERPIVGPLDVDHFLPWARHPDNGIENLVVTDQRCNNAKRDFLTAADHLARWRNRFDAHSAQSAQLAEIASRVRWDRHAEQTLSVARAIYLRLPAESKLWLRRGEFVDADRLALTTILRS